MEEQLLSDRLHAAYEVEVTPGAFDRLRVALESRPAVQRQRRRVVSFQHLVPLVAGIAVVAITSSIVIYAVEGRLAPAKNPPPAMAIQPIYAYSFFSAQDAAVHLQPPTGPAQSDRAPYLITHDGGRTWIRTPLDFPLIGLRWIDARHLVAVEGSVGPPNQVASSPDGGMTWHFTPITIPFQGATTFFLNQDEGWTLCVVSFAPCSQPQSTTTVNHTSDAGATWQEISALDNSDGVVPLRPYFTDSKHGFLSTTSTATPVLLTSVDGGKTWQEILLPEPAVEAGGFEGTSVDCGSATCALDPTMFGMDGVLTVIRQGHAPYTLTTFDGGVTWNSPRSMPFASPAAMTNPWLATLDASEWWTVDASGALYRTRDAGVTWHRIAATLPRGYLLDSVQPGANGVVWGVTRNTGSGQYLLQSTDGGLTWSFVKLPKP